MKSLKLQIRFFNVQRKQGSSYVGFRLFSSEARAETIIDIFEREMCFPPAAGVLTDGGRKASAIPDRRKAFVKDTMVIIDSIKREISDVACPKDKILHNTSPEQSPEDEAPDRTRSYAAYRVLLALCSTASWMDRDSEMKRFQIVLKPTQVAWVLKTQRSSSKAWDFFRWAARRPGYAHDEYCYSIMINLLGRSLNYACLDNLLLEMDSQNIPYSSIDLNRLIDFYACKGDVDKAEHFFTKLISLGTLPNPYLTKCMMDLFTKAGKCEKALGLFEVMMIREDIISTKSYNQLLDALSQSGKVKEALRVYGTMKDSGKKVKFTTYGVLLKALGCAGKLSEALQFLAEMVQLGMKPGQEAYNGILVALTRQGDVEMGISLFKRMAEDGVHPDFLSCEAVSNLLCEAGQARRALELACFIKSNSVKVEVYENFIKILGCGGYAQEVLMLVKAMKAELLAPPESVFLTLVDALCLEGAEATEVMAAVEEMESSYEDVSAESYKAITVSLCGTNQFIVAFDVLKRCHRKGKWFDAETYNTIFLGLSKQGKTHLLKDILEELMVIGSSVNVTTFNALLHSSAEVGDMETIKRLLDMMEAKSVFPTVDTYNAIISCFIRAGRLNAALQVFNDMALSGCFPNTSSYNSVLVILSKARLTDAISTFFKRMIADGITPDESTFNILSGLEKDFGIGE